VSIDQTLNSLPQGTDGRADEIEIAQLLHTLWNQKTWIICCTSVITLIGLLYAIFATPQYYSEATFVLKETGKGDNTSSIFSQIGELGGVGDAVAAQLGGSGNASLNKIEVILKGHELADSVITTNNLMPVLFHKQWDPENDTWRSKDPKKIPTLRAGAKKLREDLLTINIDGKKGLIQIGIKFYDPLLAKQFVDDYLVGLNNKIREDVISEAEQNREFLERQLSQTSDPILMEKINNLIAVEIEKMMFASSQSLEILEGPVAPWERSSPQRTKTVLLSFVLGLFASITWVLARRGIERFKANMTRHNTLPTNYG